MLYVFGLINFLFWNKFYLAARLEWLFYILGAHPGFRPGTFCTPRHNSRDLNQLWIILHFLPISYYFWNKTSNLSSPCLPYFKSGFKHFFSLQLLRSGWGEENLDLEKLQQMTGWMDRCNSRKQHSQEHLWGNHNWESWFFFFDNSDIPDQILRNTEKL